VLSIHSLYPQHVPKDANAFLYRVMLGGEADSANEIIKKSDAELVSLAKQRLFQTNVLQENQTQFDFEHVVVWKNYIPLPTKYQDHVFEAIWKLEALNPGLFFSGNYIQGVSVADCLKQAEMTVEKILKFSCLL
jgi:oxygen-dependent protoporphyrinogen oxidase